MKLFFSPATCSFAVHIALREAGLDFQLVGMDKKTGALDDGRRIADVNDKGYVPVLELDDGERLTEVSAILQYVADRNPESGLAPRAGTIARYRLQEWLNFIATEVHKIYWPIFHAGEEVENRKAREKLATSFRWISKRLEDKPFLMGEQFTVADAYLMTVLSWAKFGGIDLAVGWPALETYRQRVRARPAVMAALEVERLQNKW